MVVSQPDRGRGRGRRRTPSPVSAVALEHGVPLLRPERVGEPEVAEALRGHAPDLGIVVAFGQFLPRRIRELPRLGFLVNAHASLLPRHRGAAPIARAILAGDPRTGVCAMRVDKEMDAGPVCARREIPIGPDENTGELTGRLAGLAADLIAEVVDAAARGPLVWEAQDDARATLAPRIERTDAALDFDEPAQALTRRVRAMAPRPGAFTERAGEPLRILAAEAVDGRCDVPPGTVRIAPDGRPLIATREGWLAPTRLQRAGARALAVADFQRGRGLRSGERLGHAASDDAATRSPGSVPDLG